jgi:hypothetical protein
MKKNVYYHVTKGLENFMSIKETGLKAGEDNYIYLLTSKEVAAYVAKFQLGYTENYCVLEIDPYGINRNIEDDNVGELTAPYQKRIRQNIIMPEYIELEDMYKFV